VPRRLDKLTTVLYGVGSVAFGVKDGGFSFFLLLYYNQVLGLPETWVGLGIMLTLILDGLIDPLIGYFSDHLHSPWGRRHPLMYAAALPAGVSYWLLWNPPGGLSPGALFAFFVAVSIFVRVAIAVYEIPSASLVPELTDQYDERTSILSYRFFFGWWGGLTLSVVTYAFFFRPDAEHPIGQLNPVGYQRYALVASLVMVAAILISAIGTHSYIPRLRQPPRRRHVGPMGAFRELIDTLRNRSFLAIFWAGVFGSMAAGLNAALGIYFNTYFWEFTATEISVLVLTGFVAAVLAGGLAPALSLRIGKKAAAIRTAIAAVVVGPMPIVLRLMDLLPPNRAPALFWWLLFFTLVTITLIIMSSILTASMVADIVEDSEIATGRRSEGVFVAANEFVQKATSGVGIFASTLLLLVIGFPRGAKPGEVDPEIVRTLGLVYAPVIVALYLVAIGFLSTYKISRETHERNLERLATRDTSA
jgi:Na+/melibiose symporter-like transporter